MAQLGLNIDHVATLRQARRTYEPDPVWAAAAAWNVGVPCLTMHLREDRRHVQDHDVIRVMQCWFGKFNLEMAATEAMVELALKLKPHMATLVPEGRLEVTTEGGLDVAGQLATLRDVVGQMHDSQIKVSAFIDPDLEQIEAASQAGFDYCEVHTGPYAHAFFKAAGDPSDVELTQQYQAVVLAGQRIRSLNMQFNAGHALNYINVGPIAALPDLRELHIGHAIIARAVFSGLPQAATDMIQQIESAAQLGPGPGFDLIASSTASSKPTD